MYYGWRKGYHRGVKDKRRLKEIKKIIEGGAESMPFASWYFVQNVGHGHKVERN